MWIFAFKLLSILFVFVVVRFNVAVSPQRRRRFRRFKVKSIILMKNDLKLGEKDEKAAI